MQTTWLKSVFPKNQKHVDTPLVVTLGLLLLFGLFAFFSASLAQVDKASFTRIIISQIVVGLGVGGVLLYGFSRVKYLALAQWAPWSFIVAILVCFLPFVPGLGMEHGGGTRWVNLGFTTFQPGEILKFSSVLLFAWYFAKYKKRLGDMKRGLGALVVGLLCAFVVMGLQKDYGTLTIITASGAAIFIASAAPWRHFVPLIAVGLIAATLVGVFVPHVNRRLVALSDCAGLNPVNVRGVCWQVHQGLIALGAGGVSGTGYMQSVQRNGYLPEAHGDSIFAVIGEEFGFFGTMMILSLYVLFALRALYISARANDEFGALLLVGFAIMILMQSFLNIGSVLGLIPFTGEPLVFMSQGGTSLAVAMAAVGIMLSVSRTQISRPID